MSGRARAGLVALATLALVSGARVASAADPVSGRAMAFAERGRDLVVTTSFTELFDGAALEALASGFPTTVVVRVYVYRRSDELPVSLAVVQLDLVYDLWDEAFVVRSTGPRGTVTTRLSSRARAVELVTWLRELPLAPLAQLPVGVHHFAAVVAELNPVSDELQAEMRRWLTRRAGDRLDASSSFFGSFVSVFVNPRLPGADRVVRLRSQPFYRVPR